MGSALAELAERVVRRVFEALGERRVVEHHRDEGVDRAAQEDHGLTDVNELARAIAKTMAADELARLLVEDELHEAVLVADDLAARVLAVEASPHDERPS